MRRIYFLAPDIAVTKRVVDDLIPAKIDEKLILVIAKRNTPLRRSSGSHSFTKK